MVYLSRISVSVKTEHRITDKDSTGFMHMPILKTVNIGSFYKIIIFDDILS